MHEYGWRFAVDVGGTFCDVVADDPFGRRQTFKILGSGVIKGQLPPETVGLRIVDPARRVDPPAFWEGARVRLINSAGAVLHESSCRRFDCESGIIELQREIPPLPAADVHYELFHSVPAPVLAIRYLMKRRPTETIGPCLLRLGTTLATNAMLERRGARTAFVTTRGHRDILQIGDQTRPKLFKLEIRKPPPLTDCCIELCERMDASGRVIEPLDERDAREKLVTVRAAGVESVAVCLLNAYVNPTHERSAARIAREVGFRHVSVSTDLSPSQRMLPRAENCVVDAYLAPVFRDYLDQIQSLMPEARIELMTGSGGLVTRHHFTGNSTILSGPAGGLVAAAGVSRSLGGTAAETMPIIAFDMGGTSTDVSRYDGRFEFDQETRKAGIRVVAPILAIETVAAGGGSVCEFDGIRFSAGPRSAGHDPGPACYGNGGPLTITDVNLHSGRIHARRFPFPVDRQAVDRRFDELIAAIREQTAREMSASRIAQGFLDIANANMAAAVKRITIERGIDVRDHVMVCFGGAGAQHACAVARLLGITRIVIHPLAGVFSAYGIAQAEYKRFTESPVHQPCDESDKSVVTRVQALLGEMVCELTARLHDDGLPAERIRWWPSLDLRYAGTEVPLTIDLSAPINVNLRQAAHDFQNLHKRRFGYVLDRRPIEIVAARLEGSGSPAKHPATAESSHTRRSAKQPVVPIERTQISFNDHECHAPVFDMDHLHAEFACDGPALIVEPNSAIVVDPGWQVRVNSHGMIELADRTPNSATCEPSSEADPIGIELFNNQFQAIAEQMGVALRRTAVSTNVKERLDYSCAVFDADGNLVANAPHVPVHLGSMSQCVRAVLADVPDLGPEDVIATNDPFRGGTHLPDITVVTPIHIGGPRTFLVASRAHHAEIGGKRPGSMVADSTCLADEGALIRAVKIVDRGREQMDKLRSLLNAPPWPTRNIDDNLADLTAQIAANRTGADALIQLVDHYGSNVVAAYTRHVRDAAERKMRQAIGKLRDGRFSFRDSMDDGTVLNVSIDVNATDVVVDFSGTSPRHPGNLNGTPAIVSSAVLYCFRCLIDQDIPLNEGVLAPIHIILPDCFLNPGRNPSDVASAQWAGGNEWIPIDCPAVVAGNVETSQRIVDCVFGALGVVAASQGTMNNVAFGNERIAYYETICGGSGAGPDFDGAHAVHTHMTNTRLTDPEVLEARFPVRLRQFEIRRGSGGKGRHCGGDGVRRDIEFLVPMEVSLITQRRTVAPYGLAGGNPGAAGCNRLIRLDVGHDVARPPAATNSIEQVLPPIVSIQVQPGDRIIIETPGGGGYGQQISDGV